MAYSPVFSQGFLYYTEATPNDNFEVPPGFVAVIREFDMMVNIAAADAALRIQNSAAAPLINVVYLEVAAILGSAQWRGRIVVPSGGFISLFQFKFGAGMSMYVGGYLLRADLP